MAMNLPQQPQQPAQMPSMGAQQSGQVRQQPAAAENPIPGFIENRMQQAAPQEKEFIKNALANGLPAEYIPDFFGITIDPAARDYFMQVQQMISQAQNSQAGAQGAPVSPENASLSPEGEAQPAMATSQPPMA